MEIKNIAILIVIILAFNRVRLARQSATLKDKQEGETSNRWTYPLLSILYLFIILGSIIENFFFTESLNVIISSVGFIAYMTGIIGRNKAIRTLGQYWSTHIEIRNGQRIIQDGPYRYMRHPGYLSLIIESLSIPVMLNAYYSLLGVMLIYIPVIFGISKIEEKEMKKKIGNEFTTYKKRVGAFIPKNIFDCIMSSLGKRQNLKK